MRRTTGRRPSAHRPASPPGRGTPARARTRCRGRPASARHPRTAGASRAGPSQSGRSPKACDRFGAPRLVTPVRQRRRAEKHERGSRSPRTRRSAASAPDHWSGPQRNVLRTTSALSRTRYWSHLVPTVLSGFQTMTMTAAVVRPSLATTSAIPTGVRRRLRAGPRSGVRPADPVHEADLRTEDRVLRALVGLEVGRPLLEGLEPLVRVGLRAGLAGRHRGNDEQPIAGRPLVDEMGLLRNAVRPNRPPTSRCTRTRTQAPCWSTACPRASRPSRP